MKKIKTLILGLFCASVFYVETGLSQDIGNSPPNESAQSASKKDICDQLWNAMMESLNKLTIYEQGHAIIIDSLNNDLYESDLDILDAMSIGLDLTKTYYEHGRADLLLEGLEGYGCDAELKLFDERMKQNSVEE